MAKKITQLPTASFVRPQDYVPIVDINDVQTEKATFSQVVAGLDGLVATLTGSNFSGPIRGTGGLSGSLSKLVDGTSYLVAGANTFITTGSNGQITITATGGSAAAGGGSGEFQYNQAGALAGITALTYDGVKVTATLPITASMGLSTTYVSASTGVNTGFVTASIGFSGSHLSIGTSPTATSGLLRFGVNAVTDLIVMKETAVGGSDWTLLTTNPTASSLAYGNGSWYTTFQGFTVDLRAGGGDFVTITSNGTEAARFTSALNTIPVNTKFTGPLTASLGISGSHGSFGTAPVATQGTIRLMPDATFYTRDALNTTNYHCLTLGGINILGEATNTSYNAFRAYSAGAHYFQLGGIDKLTIGPNSTTAYTPILATAVTASLGVSASFLQMDSAGTIKVIDSNNTALRLPVFAYTAGSTMTFGDTTNSAYTSRLWGSGYAYLGNDSAGGAYYIANTAAPELAGYVTNTKLYEANTTRWQSHVPFTSSIGGISASFYNLNGSGVRTPSTGALRIPYNNSNHDKVITALYSDGLTTKNFLQYGPGNTWTIGNTDQNVYTDAFSIQTIAQSGGSSHYHNSGYNIYNYSRSAYDLQINSTGATFNTSLTASFGVSGSFGQLSSAQATINVPLTASLGISGSFGQFNITAARATVKPAGTLATRSTIGHRLTLTSGSAITTSDVTSTTLYLTPYTSNQIALYDGTNWLEYEVDQISLALGTLVTDKNYDVFAYDNAGTVTLELTAWTNDSTRATALVRQNGVWCKTGVLTRRYIGTIRTSSTTQTTDTVSKRFVWNYYNRVLRRFAATDSSVSWTYSSLTWQYARTGTAVIGTNAVGFVCGDIADACADVHMMCGMTGGSSHAGVGIGLDNTTNIAAGNGICNANLYANVSCRWDGQIPTAGYHYLAWLEHGENATVNWYGFSSVRAGGLQGAIWG